MARARPRYVIIGNWKFNDFDLNGQVVVDLGECNGNGMTKTSAGKPLLKRERTHHLIRFEDKKWLKGTSIPTATLTVAKDRMGKVLAPYEGAAVEDEPSAT